MTETLDRPAPDINQPPEFVDGKPVSNEQFPGSDQLGPQWADFDPYEPQPAQMSPEEKEYRQVAARVSELQGILSELTSPEPTIVSPYAKQYLANGGSARAALHEMATLLSKWEEDPRLELARAERDKFFQALGQHNRAGMQAADRAYEDALGAKVNETFEGGDKG